MTKRTRKKRRRGTPAIDYKFGPSAVSRMLSRENHLKDHPNCTYEGPHFVPPSFGDKGFFLCDVPVDTDQDIPMQLPGKGPYRCVFHMAVCPGTCETGCYQERDQRLRPGTDDDDDDDDDEEHT